MPGNGVENCIYNVVHTFEHLSSQQKNKPHIVIEQKGQNKRHCSTFRNTWYVNCDNGI